MPEHGAAQDWADRHVARWRDHWIDVAFEDDVEAIVVADRPAGPALQGRTTQEALAEVGLQDFEYDTLHHLMIRDTPGLASPSALAADLGISDAGMTGRLDALEKAGWVQRRAIADDRRRVEHRGHQGRASTCGATRWSCSGRAEEDVVHDPRRARSGQRSPGC